MNQVFVNSAFPPLVEEDLTPEHRLQLMQHIGQILPDILYVHDLKVNRNVYLNGVGLTTLGYSREEIRERGAAFLASLIHEEDRQQVTEACHKILLAADGEVITVTYRMQCKEGEWRWFSARESVFARDEAGEVWLVLGIVRDITTEQTLLQQSRAQEERWQLALTASNDGLFDADLIAGTIFISAKARAIVGYHAEDTILPIAEVQRGVHPDDVPRVRAIYEAHLAGRTPLLCVEHRQQGPSGAYVWVRTRGCCQRDAQGHPIRLVGSTTDISTQKALEAERDALTGLWNHGNFQRRLSEIVLFTEADQPLVLMTVDVDYFRYFNESFGHRAGDIVLQEVAQRLSSLASGPRDIAARIGGDEFALLLRGYRAADFGLLQLQLQALCHDLVFYASEGAPPVPLYLSTGFAAFPEEVTSGAAALALATQRLAEMRQGSDEHWTLELRNELMRTLPGFAVLNALVIAVDNRDRYTRRHSEEVAYFALMMAHTAGLDRQTQETLEIAALLHDVGKIGVASDILRQPRPLTEAEQQAMRLHPALGEAMVAPVLQRPDVLPLIRHHHEAWDGSGYPDGLAGEAIPFLARLLAVADSYSALTSDRPYRKGYSRGEALRILRDGSGKQWCPDSIALFIETFSSGSSGRHS